MGTSTFTARTEAGERKLPGILALLALLIGMVGLFVPVSAAGADNGPGQTVAGPPSHKGVHPDLLLGTQGQTCEDFDANWFEVGKIEAENLTEGGSISEDGREFTILNIVPESETNAVAYFDWEANFEPAAVFVAGGTDPGSGQAGNLFNYETATEDPSLLEDDDLYRDGSLHAPGRMRDGTFVPFAVSHISVCLERVPTPETFALNLLKVDAADDSVLAGAEFDLYLDGGTSEGEIDAGDTFVDDCTTDADGECTFTDLAAGSYLLVETDAPEGYEAASDEPVAVTIVDQDENITVENDAVVEAPETFALNLLKVDEGNPSNLLAGAQFELFSDDGATSGTLDDADTFEGACTTDGDGECEFDGLAAGDYLLVETQAPEGFVAVSDDPIGVTIVDADENVTVENAPVAVGGVVAERPDIALEKTADPVIANVGDTVTYTYTVTNTGETTLSDLVLVDDRLGVISLPDVVLQPGASTEVQATHVVTESDAEAGEIVNVAIVTGRSPAGEEVSARDSAEVAVVAVEGVTLTRPAPDAPEQEAAPETAPQRLARTGAHTGWLLLIAVMTMIGGVMVLRAADRREEARA